jgi:hypothetical protein
MGLMKTLHGIIGSMSSLMAVDIGKEIPRKYTARHAPPLLYYPSRQGSVAT